MPLNLKNKLKDIDGIDFQVATEQWLIVGEILRGQVGDPQALKNNWLKLFLDACHDVYLWQYSITIRGVSLLPYLIPRRDSRPHRGGAAPQLPAAAAALDSVVDQHD
jgi:hypothetical protein